MENETRDKIDYLNNVLICFKFNTKRIVIEAIIGGLAIVPVATGIIFTVISMLTLPLDLSSTFVWDFSIVISIYMYGTYLVKIYNKTKNINALILTNDYLVMNILKYSIFFPKEYKVQIFDIISIDYNADDELVVCYLKNEKKEQLRMYGGCFQIRLNKIVEVLKQVLDKR